MTNDKLYIDILKLAKVKLPCEIVYRTELGRVTTEQGIIRNLFSRGSHDFLILESGLPILISSVLSIQHMGG